MGNRIGFRKFARPVEITEEYNKEYLSRIDADLYVFRTTTEFKFRKGSGRGDVLSLVKKRYTPIPLKKIVLEARNAFEGKGYSVGFVRSAFYLQRNSVPAVYYLLRKDEEGNYRAAADYPARSVDPSYEPFAKFRSRGIKANAVLIPARAKSEKATSEEAAPTPSEEGTTSPEVTTSE